MAQSVEAVIFDLDGTLTQSHPGILHSVTKALTELREPIPPDEILRKFIGPPLFTSFTHYCGLSPEQAERAIAAYRAAYAQTGAFDSQVYDGLFALLDQLKERGVPLGVATSKPQPQSGRILDHFGLLPYFDAVESPNEGDHRSAKHRLISACTRRLGKTADRTLMIGDTQFDAKGAREAGVPFLGVLYGYGTKEEMCAEGALEFVLDVPQLTRVLLDKTAQTP